MELLLVALIFRRVSDCIAHIVKVKNNGKVPINYLDDYLFVALLKHLCDGQIDTFLKVCAEIKFPVSMEKTFWGQQVLIFLGLLIDTVRQMISIPVQKIEKARSLIEEMVNSKKTTVHKLQQICGYLNFLGRCIVPGKAFTRRLYSFFGPNMKPHYHLNVKVEMKEDLRVWLRFLNKPEIYCRPFIDYSQILQAEDLDWYTDASGVIGIGGFHKNRWFQHRWTKSFLKTYKPSIQFQELYAVTASVLLWGEYYQNKRIRLHCDNDSVCKILNKTSSGCDKCMKLVRLLVAKCLEWNLRVFAKWVDTKSNYLADELSRFQMDQFWRSVAKDKRRMNKFADPLPEMIWPPEKFYQKR